MRGVQGFCGARGANTSNIRRYHRRGLRPRGRGPTVTPSPSKETFIMDKPKLIDKLNQAVSLELGALLQYNQYSHVLAGPERRVWHEFFEGNAKEAFDHARKFASRVVALGGVPSVEP